MGVSNQSIEILLNGEPRWVPPDLSLLDLLHTLELDPERVAVELDRRIIKKPAWPVTKILAGARLEVVQFVGGG
jgi:thiamine biosynthesis protein ThiS